MRTINPSLMVRHGELWCPALGVKRVNGRFRDDGRHVRVYLAALEFHPHLHSELGVEIGGPFVKQGHLRQLLATHGHPQQSRRMTGVVSQIGCNTVFLMWPTQLPLSRISQRELSQTNLRRTRPQELQRYACNNIVDR